MTKPKMEKWEKDKDKMAKKAEKLVSRFEQQAALMAQKREGQKQVIELYDVIHNLHEKLKSPQTKEEFEPQIKSFEELLKKCQEDFEQLEFEAEKFLRENAPGQQQEILSAEAQAIKESQEGLIQAIDTRSNEIEKIFADAGLVYKPHGKVKIKEHASAINETRTQLKDLLARARAIDPADRNAAEKGKLISAEVDKVVARNMNFIDGLMAQFDEPVAASAPDASIEAAPAVDNGNKQAVQKPERKKSEKFEGRKQALAAKQEEITKARDEFATYVAGLTWPRDPRAKKRFGDRVAKVKRLFTPILGFSKRINVIDPNFETKLKTIEEQLRAAQAEVQKFYTRKAGTVEGAAGRDAKKELKDTGSGTAAADATKPAGKVEARPESARVGTIARYNSGTGDLKITGLTLHLQDANLGVPTLTWDKPQGGEGDVYIFDFDETHHFGIYEVGQAPETDFYVAFTLGDTQIPKTKVENKRAIANKICEVLHITAEQKAGDASAKVEKLGDVAVYLPENKVLKMAGEELDLKIEGLPDPVVQKDVGDSYTIAYGTACRVNFRKEDGVFYYAHKIGHGSLPETEFKALRLMAKQIDNFIKWAHEYAAVLAEKKEREKDKTFAIPGIGKLGSAPNEEAGGRKELAMIFDAPDVTPKLINLEIEGKRVPLDCSADTAQTAAEQTYDIQFSVYIEPAQLDASDAEHRRMRQEIKRTLRIIKDTATGVFKFQDVVGSYADDLYVTPGAAIDKQFGRALNDVMVEYKRAVEASLHQRSVDYKIIEPPRGKEKKDGGNEIAVGTLVAFNPDNKSFVFGDPALTPVSFNVDLVALKKQVVVLGKGKQQTHNALEESKFTFSSSFISTRTSKTKVTKSCLVSFNIIRNTETNAVTFVQEDEQGRSEQEVRSASELRDIIEEVRHIFNGRIEDLLASDKDLEPIDYYAANVEERGLLPVETIPDIGEFDPNSKVFTFLDKTTFELGKEMPFALLTKNVQQRVGASGGEVAINFYTNDQLMAPKPMRKLRDNEPDPVLDIGIKLIIKKDGDAAALDGYIIQNGEERPNYEEIPTAGPNDEPIALTDQLKFFLEHFVEVYKNIYAEKRDGAYTGVQREAYDPTKQTTSKRQEAAPVGAHFNPEAALKEIQDKKTREALLAIDKGINFDSDKAEFTFEGVPGWTTVNIAELLQPYAIECTTAMQVAERSQAIDFTYAYVDGKKRPQEISYGLIISKDPEDSSYKLYRTHNGVMVNTFNVSKNTFPAYLHQQFAYDFRLLVANERHLAEAVRAEESDPAAAEQKALLEIEQATKRIPTPAQRLAHEQAQRAVAEGAIDPADAQKMAEVQRINDTIGTAVEKQERKMWQQKTVDTIIGLRAEFKRLPASPVEREAVLALIPVDTKIDLFERMSVFETLNTPSLNTLVQAVADDMQSEAAGLYPKEIALKEGYLQDILNLKDALKNAFETIEAQKQQRDKMRTDAINALTNLRDLLRVVPTNAEHKALLFKHLTPAQQTDIEASANIFALMNDAELARIVEHVYDDVRAGEGKNNFTAEMAAMTEYKNGFVEMAATLQTALEELVNEQYNQKMEFLTDEVDAQRDAIVQVLSKTIPSNEYRSKLFYTLYPEAKVWDSESRLKHIYAQVPELAAWGVDASLKVNDFEKTFAKKMEALEGKTSGDVLTQLKVFGEVKAELTLLAKNLEAALQLDALEIVTQHTDFTIMDVVNQIDTLPTPPDLRASFLKGSPELMTMVPVGEPLTLQTCQEAFVAVRLNIKNDTILSLADKVDLMTEFEQELVRIGAYVRQTADTYWTEKNVRNKPEDMERAIEAAKQDVFGHRYWSPDHFTDLVTRLVKNGVLTAEQKKQLALGAKLTIDEAAVKLEEFITQTVWSDAPNNETEQDKKHILDLTRSWAVWRTIIYDELNLMIVDADKRQAEEDAKRVQELDKELRKLEQQQKEKDEKRAQELAKLLEEVKKTSERTRKMAQDVARFNTERTRPLTAAEATEAVRNLFEKPTVWPRKNEMKKDFDSNFAQQAKFREAFTRENQHNPNPKFEASAHAPAAVRGGGGGGGGGLETVHTTQTTPARRRTPRPEPITQDVVPTAAQQKAREQEGEVLFDATKTKTKQTHVEAPAVTTAAQAEEVKDTPKQAAPKLTWGQRFRRWAKLGAIAGTVGLGGSTVYETAKAVDRQGEVQKTEAKTEAPNAAPPVKAKEAVEAVEPSKLSDTLSSAQITENERKMTTVLKPAFERLNDTSMDRLEVAESVFGKVVLVSSRSNAHTELAEKLDGIFERAPLTGINEMIRSLEKQGVQIPLTVEEGIFLGDESVAKKVKGSADNSKYNAVLAPGGSHAIRFYFADGESFFITDPNVMFAQENDGRIVIVKRNGDSYYPNIKYDASTKSLSITDPNKDAIKIASAN